MALEQPFCFFKTPPEEHELPFCFFKTPPQEHELPLIFFIMPPHASEDEFSGPKRSLQDPEWAFLFFRTATQAYCRGQSPIKSANAGPREGDLNV